MLASDCVPLSAIAGPVVESHGIVGTNPIVDLIGASSWCPRRAARC